MRTGIGLVVTISSHAGAREVASRRAYAWGSRRVNRAMLRRAADAGRAWAHAALEPDAPLLYVAAGGFTAGLREAVETSGHPATCWDLGDVYAAR